MSSGKTETMRVFVDDEGWVQLDDGDLVAEGGQGCVFARGDRAYKIATNPAAILDPRKLAALAVIRSDRIVKPLASIRTAPGGDAVGHVMHRVHKAVPWMQLVPRAARARFGLDRASSSTLCERLRELLVELHALDIAAVDLSSGNVLVDVRRRLPWLIDVDSMQTPGFPATAITAQIADPIANGRYGPASDWFAYAILTFELQIGIHPFRGTHPHVVGLEARMAAGISVLDPEVALPPVCDDPRTLPDAWLAWYDDTFRGRLRAPPPTTNASAPRPARRRASRVAARSDGGIIRGIVVEDAPRASAHVWWWTDERVGCGEQVLGATPPGAIGLVHCPRGEPRVAMLCHADDGALSLVTADGTPHELGVKATDARVDTGIVLLRCGDRLARLDLRAREIAGADPASRWWASVRAIGRVHAGSCVLWSGCATTRMLGTGHVLALDARSVMPRDLADAGPRGRARIVDAAAHAGIVVLLVEAEEHHDRWVFDARTPERDALLVERDVDPVGCAAVCAADGTVWVRLTSGAAAVRPRCSMGPLVPIADGAIVGGAQGLFRIVGDEVWPLLLLP